MTTEDSGIPAATAEDHQPDPVESIIRLWQERGRFTAEADRILTLAGENHDPEAQQRADADEKTHNRHGNRIAEIER